DLGLALGDQRTRDGRAEQVLALVDGSGAEHRKDEVAHELLAQVLDDALHRAGGARLGVETVELLGLPQVGAEGDDLRLVAVDEPAQDDRGVEAAGIGEHDAAHGGAHDAVALLAHGAGANQEATARAGLGCGCQDLADLRSRSIPGGDICRPATALSTGVTAMGGCRLPATRSLAIWRRWPFVRRKRSTATWRSGDTRSGDDRHARGPDHPHELSPLPVRPLQCDAAPPRALA